MTHPELSATILAAVVQQIESMDPSLTADVAEQLHEIAADGAIYAMTAAAGDARAQALQKTLENRLRTLQATLAGRGQDKIAAAIVAGFSVAAKVAAALIASA